MLYLDIYLFIFEPSLYLLLFQFCYVSEFLFVCVCLWHLPEGMFAQRGVLIHYRLFLWCEERVRDEKREWTRCPPCTPTPTQSHPDTPKHTHETTRGKWASANTVQHILLFSQGGGGVAVLNIHKSKIHNPTIVLKSPFSKDASLAWVKNQRNMQQIIGNISAQHTVYMSQCFCALCLQGLWAYLTASRTYEKVCSTRSTSPASPSHCVDGDV